MSNKFLKLDREVMKFFWKDIEPLFQKVLDQDTSDRDSLEMIAMKIADGTLEVWVSKGENNIIQAVYCTSIINYPTKRSLFWGYMGATDNKLNEWKNDMVQEN